MNQFNTQLNTMEIPDENHILNIEGFVQTLTEEPSYTPRKLSDQVVLVRTGGSTAAYFYDTKNATWKKVVLT